MRSIIDQRQITEFQKEQLELEKVAPQKFDPEIEFPIQKKLMGDFTQGKYKAMTLEETQALLALDVKSVQEKPKTNNPNYSTYSREEVEKMVREHLEYKENEQRKKCGSKDEELLKVSKLKK
jgi:TPP-dependent indolepyruvate ferredoxin oxidoreductase alpha subunit